MGHDTNRATGAIHFDQPIRLDSGAWLASPTVAYETYGTLDATCSNAILVCHALTGSAHVAGTDDSGNHGWWSRLVGPGLAIDTDRYFVLSTNVIGSCYGSTGPRSTDPTTGREYGTDFPIITIRDMVRAQRQTLGELGIDRLHAVIGGSMGGMQVLEWGLLYPNIPDLLIPIATAARHSPWAVAFNAIAREAIALGRALNDPAAGLRLARKIAMLTYRSDLEFSERFGRERTGEDFFTVDGTFEVEHWLEHHGRRLVERFDIDTFEAITRAMDLHDVTRGGRSLAEALGSIRQPTLCVGISSDILYPPHEQKSLAEGIPNCTYREINSPCGHDAFLIEFDQLNTIVGEFLQEHEAISQEPSSRLSYHGNDSEHGNSALSINDISYTNGDILR